MKHFTTTALIGLALCAAPAIGFAQEIPERFVGGGHLANEAVAPRPQGADTTIPYARFAQPLGSFPVNTRVERDVGNGCKYVSTVRGRVRMLRTRDETRDGQIRYRPHLTVASAVRCDDGRTLASATSRRITVWPVTRQRLEHLVERRATLVATHGERSCTYAPQLSIDRDVRIQAADLHTACTEDTGFARGGGPSPATRVRHHHYHR